MSNDKAAATYHGKIVTPGPHAEINRKRSLNPPPDTAFATGPNWCCWMGRHTNGADHVRMCEHYQATADHPRTPQTTGEHTKAKLEDPQYGVPAAEAAAGMAFQMSQLAQHTGSSVPGVPASEERYAGESAPVRRGWTPTKREIQVAAALFLVLVAVSGWVFRALG